MNKTVSQRLDVAIDSWRSWQPGLSRRPQVVDSLPGGLTNTSWLVETDRGLVVVRINSPHDKSLNIDRHREEHIHRAVAWAGLAPAIVFCDALKGFLVSEYIRGTIWQAESFQRTDNQKKLLQLLDSIQKIRLPLPKFDYWQHLCHYDFFLKSLGATIPDDLNNRKKNHQRQIQEFQSAPWRPVLTHHDLQSGNIIERKGRLYVIDWEYAAMGCGDMDCQVAGGKNDGGWAVIPLLQSLISDYWLLVKNQVTELQQ